MAHQTTTKAQAPAKAASERAESSEKNPANMTLEKINSEPKARWPGFHRLPAAGRGLRRCHFGWLPALLLAVTAGRSAGQTRVDLPSQTKRVDFSQATSTKPAKTGTVLPGACSVGEQFFKQDATAGTNLYGCVATNTWSLLGNTYNSMATALGDVKAIRESATQVSVGSGCGTATPCNVRVGDVVYTYTTVVLANSPVGSGTVRVGIDAASGNRMAWHNLTGLTCSGWSCVGGTAVWPADVIPVAECTVSGGTFDAIGCQDRRAVLSRDLLQIGAGLQKSGTVVSLGPTVPTFSSGTSAPPGTCVVGERYVRSDTQQEYACTAANTFSEVTGLASLNGLGGPSQTFVNDENVTVTSEGTAHTLGWTGQLGASRGGTGLSAAADDGVMVGDGLAWQSKAIPACTDTAGSHLNYDSATNTFTCGTAAQIEVQAGGVTTGARGKLNLNSGTGTTAECSEEAGHARVNCQVNADTNVLATQSAVQSGQMYAAADTGGDDSYAACPTPAVASLTAGLTVNLRVDSASSGAATLDLCGLGERPIVRRGGGISDGDVRAASNNLLMYDSASGGRWEMVSLEASAPNRTRLFSTTIDGGGEAITAGTKAYWSAPSNCTLSKVTLLADASGAIVIDLWKDTYENFPPTVADSITASAKPTLNNEQKSTDAVLSGWTKTVTAGDTIGVHVDSASTVTQVSLHLECVE